MRYRKASKSKAIHDFKAKEVKSSLEEEKQNKWNCNKGLNEGGLDNLGKTAPQQLALNLCASVHHTIIRPISTNIYTSFSCTSCLLLLGKGRSLQLYSLLVLLFPSEKSTSTLTLGGFFQYSLALPQFAVKVWVFLFLEVQMCSLLPLPNWPTSVCVASFLQR